MAVPREVWSRFFSSAGREIGILAYSALFLAEDTGILRLLAEKGRAGVNIRIALEDPETSHAALRGDEDTGDAVPAKIRKALALYQSVAGVENVEIRLHQTVLYNSIYRADDQLIVNQHAYGIPAAHAPVFCLRDAGGGEMIGYTATASNACGLRRYRLRRAADLAQCVVVCAVAQNLAAGNLEMGAPWRTARKQPYGDVV